jgi:hypothetical protein
VQPLKHTGRHERHDECLAAIDRIDLLHIRLPELRIAADLKEVRDDERLFPFGHIGHGLVVVRHMRHGGDLVFRPQDRGAEAVGRGRHAGAARASLIKAHGAHGHEGRALELRDKAVGLAVRLDGLQKILLGR